MSTFLLNTKPGTRELLGAAAAALGWVAALFSATVLLLLAANYVHSGIVGQLDSPEITALMDDLSATPGNAETKAQVRALDQLTREMFFFSVVFRQRGAILLIAGLMVTALSFLARRAVMLPLPQPGKPDLDGSDLRLAAMTRRSIAGLSLLVLVASAVAVYRFGSLPRFPTIPVERAAVQDDTPVDTAAESLSSTAIPGYWPCFRGEGGIGVSSVTNVPLQWNAEESENVLWKVQLPLSGFSSPIVVAGRVFLTAASRETLLVLCFDLAAGSLLWQRPIPTELSASEMPDISDETTYAAPTMAVAGDRVIGIFGTGDVAALDMLGRIAWRRNLGAPMSIYGYASSLAASGDRAFVQYDCEESQRVIALDAATGSTLWETARSVMPSWSSPSLMTVDAQEQLLLCANPFVAAYSPVDGSELWRAEGLGGEPGPSLAYAGGMVYAASDFSVIMAVDTMLPDEPVWQATENLPDVSSPLASRERVYMASSSGIVTCFNRIDGTELWMHEFDDGFYSSPILAGKRIYLTDLSGQTFVFEDADTYRQLAVSPLGERCSATPAFIPGRIIFRGASHLVCVGTP